MMPAIRTSILRFSEMETSRRFLRSRSRSAPPGLNSNMDKIEARPGTPVALMNVAPQVIHEEVELNTASTSSTPLLSKRRRSKDVPESSSSTRAGRSLRGYVKDPASPSCRMKVTFQETSAAHSDVDIPPAFYAGATIPTLLNLVISKNSALTHSLEASLKMTLTGTLSIVGQPERTILAETVSLKDGLKLWEKDAAAAHQRRVMGDHPLVAPLDPSIALPAGVYSLPLSVSIPNTKLPPSYDDAPGQAFKVSYSLSIVLESGTGSILSSVTKPFSLLPVTMPDLAPMIDTIICPGGRNRANSTGSEIEGSAWTIVPSMPTSTYSPTSVIPLSLSFSSPSSEPTIAFVRASIIRSQKLSYRVPADSATFREGLVEESSISSRCGWFELAGQGKTTSLENLVVPLIADGEAWQYGFTTVATAPYGICVGNDTEETRASSTFFLRLDVDLVDALPNLSHMPALNTLSDPATDIDHRIPRSVRSQCLEIPIIVGSVGEPREAMHWIRWNDLVLRNVVDAQGRTEERARMVAGGDFSCERGWLVAPPSYEESQMEGLERGVRITHISVTEKE